MRRLFAKLSLAAILVLSALPHYAGAADSHAKRDSIGRALPAMSAAERLAAYSELAEIAEPDEAIVWIDLMENLARQTGDEAGIIAAMYKRAMYYYVAGTLEEFLDASGAVAPLLLEAGDKRYVFTEILVIKRLIAEGREDVSPQRPRDLPYLSRRPRQGPQESGEGGGLPGSLRKPGQPAVQQGFSHVLPLSRAI